MYEEHLVKPVQVLVNHQLQDRLLVLDRGVQFGDGLFETMVACHGEILQWDYHKQRLVLGLDRLGINLPSTAFTDFQQWAQRVSVAAPKVLKWLVTRGPSLRGYAPPQRPTPTQIFQCFDYEGFDADKWLGGVEVSISPVPISQNTYFAGLKHLNRLDSVLAKQQQCGIKEPLLALSSGEIVEASIGNLFWFDGQQWWTPPIDVAGVKGVIRACLLTEAESELGVAFGEKPLFWEELDQCPAAFLCNKVIGIWPIVNQRALRAKRQASSVGHETLGQLWQPLRRVQRLIFARCQGHDKSLYDALSAEQGF